MVPLSICSFIEVSLGCSCASLATLRPLLQKVGLGALTKSATEEEAGSGEWERLSADGKKASHSEQDDIVGMLPPKGY